MELLLRDKHWLNSVPEFHSNCRERSSLGKKQLPPALPKVKLESNNIQIWLQALLPRGKKKSLTALFHDGFQDLDPAPLQQFKGMAQLILHIVPFLISLHLLQNHHHYYYYDSWRGNNIVSHFRVASCFPCSPSPSVFFKICVNFQK